MTKTKRTHYVQRAYLKNFACNESKTLIWVFNKYRKSIYFIPKKIRDVTRKFFYYSQWLEEWFNKNIESDGIIIIKKLIDTWNYSRLTLKEKKILLEWIQVQLIRTPDYEDLIFNMVNQLIMELQKKNTSIFPEKFLVEFNNRNCDLRNMPTYYTELRQVWWDSISNKENYNYNLLNLDWILFVNETIYNYFTSDNPVNLWKSGNSFINNVFNFEWVGSKDNFLPQRFFIELRDNIMYFIPLNPKLLLLICSPNANFSPITRQNNITQVYHMNSMITAQARKYVLSNEIFFEHAYMTIDKYPDCIKKNNRIVSSKVSKISAFKI